MIEYVKKADVLEIINSPLPRDIAAEYLYELDGVWLDEEEGNGDVVYLLMYYWADFETHEDILGVYETRELAEKAAKEYRNSHSLSIDPDSELCVEEALLNRFVWERDYSRTWMIQ